MKKTPCRFGFMGLMSCLVFAGCTNNPYFSKPPTAEVRASLGRVVVQSASPVTLAGVDKPYTPGEAAAAGAMDAISGLGGSGGGGDFGGVGIVMLPIAAVVGGTVGGMHGTPEAEAQAEWQVLSDYCARLDFQGALRRNVVLAMERYTRIPVAGSGGSGGPPPRNADTLLELSVLRVGLMGERYENSPLSVVMIVQARLVRLSDGSELYQHIWTQSGDRHTYRELAARDARLFRHELSRVCGKAAMTMVKEMFANRPARRSGWWSAN